MCACCAAVRQLDDDDSQVLGHREEHLAQILDLLLFRVRNASLAQLSNAVNENEGLQG